jgi:hypothetical protein
MSRKIWEAKQSHRVTFLFLENSTRPFVIASDVGVLNLKASQIFLDIHHIMRHSTLGAFGDLRMSGLRIQKIIDEYLKLSKTHPQPKFWPKEGDEEIRAISATVDSWIIQDAYIEVE